MKIEGLRVLSMIIFFGTLLAVLIFGCGFDMRPFLLGLCMGFLLGIRYVGVVAAELKMRIQALVNGDAPAEKRIIKQMGKDLRRMARNSG